MKATGSSGEDNFSVNILKQVQSAQSELEPALLNLVNSTVKTKSFPQSLKTTKVIPIRKQRK